MLAFCKANPKERPIRDTIKGASRGIEERLGFM